MQPHRQQPTRLPRPWDSPGKNTGMGCHFLLQCMKVKSESEVARSCPTLSNPMDCSLPGSSIHGIFQARVLEWGAIAFSESHGSHSYKTLLTLAASVFNLTPNFYSLATVMAFFQFLRDLKLMQGLNICFPFLEDSSSRFQNNLFLLSGILRVGW